MDGHVSCLFPLPEGMEELQFRNNKDVEPLSEAGPSANDREQDKNLMAELRAFGAFEEQDKDEIRASALAEVSELVSVWTVGYLERKGRAGVDKKQACIIVPFGSYCLGVHSNESDIDVLAIMPKAVMRQDFFVELEPLLRQHDSVSSVHVIVDAFVPVIKLVCNGVDIDLSMARVPFDQLPPKLDITNNDVLKDISDPKDVTCLNGPRVTFELLRRVQNVDNFRMFLRCIKLWARRKGVYANIVGFPGGVAWAIMAASVCQLYPKMIPSMLMEKFFFLYMNWNFENPIKIAPLEECRPPQGAVYMAQWSPALRRPMQVITPTYPTANATFNSSMSTVSIIKQEIAAAHALVQEVGRGKLPFSALFSPSDFFAKYSNYVSVEVIAFRPEAMKKYYAYVESQIRKLVEKLEADPYAGLQIAHPCTEHFGPRSIEGLDAQHVFFFVGLKFDDELVKQMKAEGKSVNLTPPVSDFIRYLSVFDDTDISVQVVKRKMVPQWVRDSYSDMWKTSTSERDTSKRKRAGETEDQAAAEAGEKRPKQ